MAYKKSSRSAAEYMELAKRDRADCRSVEMDQELLGALSVITEEEQRILNGRDNIDQKIYTEKKRADRGLR